MSHHSPHRGVVLRPNIRTVTRARAEMDLADRLAVMTHDERVALYVTLDREWRRAAREMYPELARTMLKVAR